MSRKEDSHYGGPTLKKKKKCERRAVKSVVCAYLEMSLNHIVDVDKVNEESFFLSESVSGNSTTDQFD